MTKEIHRQFAIQCRRLLLVACCLIVTNTGGGVFAITPQDIVDINGTTAWYNKNFTDCASTGGATSPGAAVSQSKEKADNAKIIMGIAKSYNLGEKGALIGIMTSLTETHLRNYANSGVPISMQNPAWLALSEPRPLGNDHDSVGIMQQRVGSGWSTNGSGTSQDIVWQLMDPAYAAQAFFGTPPGAQLPANLKNPGALKKGLQNLSQDWKSMDPGAAAQAVQISAFPDRYNNNKAEAQGLLDQYWADAPAIPLPIPVTGGAGDGGANTSTVDCSSSFNGGSLTETILAYAWPDYHEAPYFDMKPQYAAAVKEAQAKGGYVGGGPHPGIDCGGYITLLMRNSNTDPTYNSYNGDVGAQQRYMDEHPDRYMKLSGVKYITDLKLGDIFITSDRGHTYMFVGQIPNFHGNITSASFSTTGQSWRTPMAETIRTIEAGTWYRLKQ